MKIERKLISSNIINGAFIILIGFFAFQNLNLVLTKLRFVEIADDLNASFLEMRLSEKNYFLYHDKKALPEIRRRAGRHYPGDRRNRPEQTRVTPPCLFDGH
jgi:two-component system NtrC family sensor kinase